MTRPSPTSSRRRAHHRSRAPERPTCETNLFVTADRGHHGERRCHHCGWTTTFDDAGEDVAEVVGPRRGRIVRARPGGVVRGGNRYFDASEHTDYDYGCPDCSDDESWVVFDA